MRFGVSRRLMLGVSLVLLAGACSGSGGHAAAPTTSSKPTHTATSSTTAVQQTSGSRTVLSPIGVNVRAQPNSSAKVLGTAAQGVVLTVLGHTATGGGWYEVKGATVIGYMSDAPSLSAPGEYRSYSSGVFNALYPASWSAVPTPPVSVVFRPSSGSETIVVTVAPSASALPTGGVGYGRNSFSQIIVCGVTSEFVTYKRAPSPAAAAPYLAQVRLTLDPHHALRIDGHLFDVGPQLQIYQAFLASLTFPFPQCVGR